MFLATFFSEFTRHTANTAAMFGVAESIAIREFAAAVVESAPLCAALKASRIVPNTSTANPMNMMREEICFFMVFPFRTPFPDFSRLRIAAIVTALR